MHQAGRQQGLDGDVGPRVTSEESVENGVADLVGELVGMSFGNGFRREESTGHGCTSSHGREYTCRADPPTILSIHIG